MTTSQAQTFAAEWVAAWNRHDVDAVLAAGLFEYLTPSMAAHFMDEAARILKTGGHLVFSYIPVMDGPVLQGVISFYDMAQAVVAAQQFENDMLKAYIRDWPVSDSGSPAEASARPVQ